VSCCPDNKAANARLSSYQGPARADD
jgi:hypothetical protein